MAENLPAKNNSQILIYQTEGGKTKIEVLLEDGTFWLTQKLIAELFQTTIPNVNMHIKNIFEERELNPDSVIKFFLTTAADGKNYRMKFYNPDMIISVGYRVKSHVATRFRQWATWRLREYIVKGFVLDAERLKNPDQPFDYFDELLRRIQDILTSERRFYQKITDIYATIIDYGPTTELSLMFFKTVQNKLNWAIAEKTDTELIYSRADSDKPNMGLTSWRGEKVHKHDVAIAKNYLDGDELRGLNNHARAISCLCKRTGDAPHHHAHERLDRKTGQLFAVKRPKYSGTCKEGYRMKLPRSWRKQNMKNSTGSVYDTATQKRTIVMRLLNR